jgi:hypothetical protein
MTNTQQYPHTADRLAPTAPGVVRRRLRVLHLVAGGLLGAYPYLPGTLPGHGALRWSLMLVLVPAVTASGLWMWRQAAVRRWHRRSARRRD